LENARISGAPHHPHFVRELPPEGKPRNGVTLAFPLGGRVSNSSAV